MKFKFLNLFLLLFTYLFLFTDGNIILAQNHKDIDSMEALLPKTKDSKKGDLLLSISDKYSDIDADKALKYGNQALDLFSKLDDKKGIVKAYNLIAYAYSVKNDFANDEIFLLKAFELNTKIGDNEGLAYSYNKLGLYNYSQNIYPEAISNYKKALEIAQKNSELETGRALNNLGAVYRKQDSLELAMSFFKKALPHFEKINNKDGLSKTYNYMGLINFSWAKYKEAIDCYQKAIKFREESGDDYGSAILYNNIGNIYFRWASFEEASSNFHKALSLFSKINYKQGIESCYSNLALVNFNLEKFDKALEYHSKALEIAEESGNQKEVANKLNNIALVYEKKTLSNLTHKYGKDFEEYIIRNNQEDDALIEFKNSIDYNNKALKIKTEINDKPGLAQTYHNLGQVYNYAGFPEKALTYIMQALRINEELKNISDVIKNLQGIGIAYTKLNNFDKALEFLNRALKYSVDTRSKDDIEVSSEYLSILYEKMNNYSKALEYFKQYIDYKDSVKSEQTMNFFNISQAKSETELSQTQNKLLNIQKELQERQNSQLRLTIYLFIAVFIFILIMIFLLIKQNNEKKKANIELALKNHLISDQKKEITDSIHYASRIQRAVLPPKEYLQKILTDHFILFKPRDIVSGDFFWLSEKNNKIYVVAADCTGHGVPGAFMSMLGVAFLNEIINQGEFLHANEILNMLRSHIIQSLHQTGKEGENQDGMDMSFYILDKENMELEFSGANNPLIIIRSGEVIELKGDRMPIGIHANHEDPFNMQLYKVEKGDIVYSFSDGFPDQFGGPDNKKYMIKRLKNTLKEINPLSMDEQMTTLDKAFMDWKHTNDQIDDILVIGVKI